MALPDDLTPHAVYGPMQVHREPGKGGGSPASAGSTKVAWTLRQKGEIVEVFDFAINPQGINRVESSRATVSSTKGGHYVDDFGNGPSQITVRQLVASGQWVSRGDALAERYTLREDVQRFIKTIWLPATRPVNKGRVEVFFNDNHLEQGHEERVTFPTNGLTISRSVDQQGLWLLELQMIGLERNPYSDVVAREKHPKQIKNYRRYIVKRGDTLHGIVVRVAGPRASHTTQHQVLARILQLNPGLRHKRTIRIDGKDVPAKPMRVVPGEVVRVPI